MTTHEWLDIFNAIWLSVPAYHDLTPKTKPYEEVFQWNGKGMNGMSQYLLGVVTQSLRGGSPTQRPIFNCPIECTQTLLEINEYARYKSHDDAILSYMEDALSRFHTFKDIFFLCRAGKKGKAKANALTTELVKKPKVDKDMYAETWMPSMMWHEMIPWRDFISHERDVVTAQEGTKVLRKYRRKIRKVWKELCYGKAETLEDAEEAAKMVAV